MGCERSGVVRHVDGKVTRGRMCERPWAQAILDGHRILVATGYFGVGLNPASAHSVVDGCYHGSEG
jgi:hypothetical protein